MLMFTNATACTCFECKTGKQKIIPAKCYVYITASNSNEYTIKKLCFGGEMVEVVKTEFERKFTRC